MMKWWLGLACVGSISAGCNGCRSDGETADAGAPSMPSTVASTSEDAGVTAVRPREPAVDAGAHLDPIDPACTDAVDLERALVDARCAISADKSKALRSAIEGADGGATAPLAQEAKIEGDRVVVRLINKGSKPLVLPLSYHPDVEAFSMLLEEEHALYELVPTKLAPADAGSAARFARIQLAPGAAATVRTALPSKIAKRIAPACEAGTCAPSSIAPGRYKLHVGQLVADVESGLPASVEWVVK